MTQTVFCMAVSLLTVGMLRPLHFYPLVLWSRPFNRLGQECQTATRRTVFWCPEGRTSINMGCQGSRGVTSPRKIQKMCGHDSKGCGLAMGLSRSG